jgi:hypothetical protein
VSRGHEVTGMTHSASKQALLRGLGATPPWPTRSTPAPWPPPCAAAEPDVVLHQLTALAGSLDLAPTSTATSS